MLTTRTLAHAWHLTAPITPAAAADVARTAADTGLTLTANPSTLAGMARAVSPFGPLARSVTHAAHVLGCPVEVDVTAPDGIVIAH